MIKNKTIKILSSVFGENELRKITKEINDLSFYSEDCSDSINNLKNFNIQTIYDVINHYKKKDDEWFVKYYHGKEFYDFLLKLLEIAGEHKQELEKVISSKITDKATILFIVNNLLEVLKETKDITKYQEEFKKFLIVDFERKTGIKINDNL